MFDGMTEAESVEVLDVRKHLMTLNYKQIRSIAKWCIDDLYRGLEIQPEKPKEGLK